MLPSKRHLFFFSSFRASFLEFYSVELFIEMSELCDTHSKCCFTLLRFALANQTRPMLKRRYYFVPKGNSLSNILFIYKVVLWIRYDFIDSLLRFYRSHQWNFSLKWISFDTFDIAMMIMYSLLCMRRNHIEFYWFFGEWEKSSQPN